MVVSDKEQNIQKRAFVMAQEIELLFRSELQKAKDAGLYTKYDPVVTSKILISNI